MQGLRDDSKERLKLFLQPGVFSNADKVINYVNPSSQSKWGRKSSLDSRQQRNDQVSEVYEGYDAYPSFYEPQYMRSQFEHPFASSQPEKEKNLDEPSMILQDRTVLQHSIDNNYRNMASYKNTEPQKNLIPPTAAHPRLSRNSSRENIRPSTTQKRSGLPVSNSRAHAKDGSISSTQVTISQKANRASAYDYSQKENKENVKFTRSPSLACVTKPNKEKEYYNVEVEELNGILFQI